MLREEQSYKVWLSPQEVEITHTSYCPYRNRRLTRTRLKIQEPIRKWEQLSVVVIYYYFKWFKSPIWVVGNKEASRIQRGSHWKYPVSGIWKGSEAYIYIHLLLTLRVMHDKLKSLKRFETHGIITTEFECMINTLVRVQDTSLIHGSVCSLQEIFASDQKINYYCTWLKSR